MFGATRNLRQPPFGAQVNWRHPLSRGLTAAHVFNGSGGLAVCSVNLVDSVPWFSGTGLPVQRVRQPGLGVDTTALDAVYRLTSPATTRFQTSTASLFWYGIPLSTGVAHTACIIGVSTVSFLCYAIARDVSADTSLYVLWNNGSNQSLIIPSAWTNNAPTTVGMTIDGTTATGYVAGVNVGSTTTNVGTITFAGANYISIGGGSGNATNDTSAIFSSCAYFWNRALTASEMVQLNADPFAPVRVAWAAVPQFVTGPMTGLQSSMVVPIITIQQW